MTRTTRAGYLRDVRRLTVALSRARLGLYVLGRRAVFENCPELRPAFDVLFARGRPDRLALVTGELWPSRRLARDEEEAGEEVEGQVQMEGVEHLMQYVAEMTAAKVKQLAELDVVVVEETRDVEEDDEEGDDDEGQQGYADQDDGEAEDEEADEEAQEPVPLGDIEEEDGENEELAEKV